MRRGKVAFTVVFALGALLLSSVAARAESMTSAAAGGVNQTQMECRDQANRLQDCQQAATETTLGTAGYVYVEGQSTWMYTQRHASLAKITSRAAAKAGELIAQYHALTDRVAAISAELTEAEVRIWSDPLNRYYSVGLDGLHTISAAGEFGNGDSLSNFTYTLDATLYWNNAKLNGLAKFVLYIADPPPSDLYNFTASSQWASVTPRGGAAMDALETALQPYQPTEIVAAMPKSISSYGSGGSSGISATLSGEIKNSGGNVGASFGISRTWERPAGWAGGGVMSNHTHFTYWQAEAVDGFTKGVEGVSTWKTPSGYCACFRNTAVAWYRG